MPKNKPKNKKFWQFRNATESVGELLLYGDISDLSWWGDEVTPKQFKEDLDALGDISTLKVFINSGGGDVFAGQAIHSMLKRHKATKTVYIDGLAASIASVIAMAGDKIVMPKNAMMMVHKCWTWTVGNANDMRKMADDMDKIDESIVAAYEEKSRLEKEKIVELMDSETWMTAEEAVEYGFADEIEDTKQVAASMSKGYLTINGQAFDLSRYSNPPKFASIPGVFQNEGRTLSAANEQRIGQARDLLNEVLDQLEGSSGTEGKLKLGKARSILARQNLVKPKNQEEMGGMEECCCKCCNHSDNCQSAGAKCCICGNCEMADKCSKPGAEGCMCKDCTMATNNCCQPGSESCMCDSCTNMDCKKGHGDEDEHEEEEGHEEEGMSDSLKNKKQLLELQAQIIKNRRKANV